jgi:hypothetical protein
MANQKLTQEELQSIADLQQKNNAVVSELGQIELARMSVSARRANAENFLAELRKSEEELANSLNEKYGAGSIDLQNGEFVPAPQPEATAPAEDEAPTLE